ncbi:MAG: hypothetical protein HZB57_00895 [Gammaproteobacteria bacterium]|nr:hypothetical protein [Gammaproteobacteria bacterium]
MSKQGLTLTLLALAFTSTNGICLGAETDDGFPSIDFHGLVDTRLVSADAERNWLDGDFGKTRYGEGDTSTQPRLAEASLIALPRFNWSTSGYLHLKADPDQVHALDIVEGYLAYQPVSTQSYRFRAKLGAFYPPISLENTGIGWTSPYTLSYSAINSWVGEELRGLGAEASIVHNGELHDVSVVAALTAANDRAGTLLYRRGWALHDFKPGLNDTYPLPPRPSAPNAEPECETPFLEIDERAGYYAGANWRYDERYSVHALYFDNHADPESRESGEASWLTRFSSLGTQLELNDGITVLAQYMVGDTLIDVGTRDIVLDYQAAYVLASKALGKHRFTLRGDRFDTTHRGASYGSDLSENGWAATLAYSYAVAEKQRLFLELLDIDSSRESREAIGQDEDVRDHQFQVGYRLFF